MSKKEQKEHKLKNQNVHPEEAELLEETKELEQASKLNEEMLKLEEEIHTLTEEKKALEEKVRLAQAEQINYRKRKDEELTSTLKYANQALISELIGVVDNFERALDVNEEELDEKYKKHLTGIKMTYATLLDVLKKYGVEEINRVGEVFDPNQEEALLTDSVAELEDDVVIEVLLKGYKLKDRVIRPASVKINQK